MCILKLGIKIQKLKGIQYGIWKTDSEIIPYQLDFRPRGHNGKRF